MDDKNGGQSLAERQKATAAEIARRKVLEAYGKAPENYAPAEGGEMPVVNEADWKQYHSAWQDYYQKYYGKYYQQAAKDYVEKEKLKLEREQAEAPEKVAAAEVLKSGERPAGGVREAREAIRKKASGRVRKIKKSKHFVPLVIGIGIVVLALFVQYYRVIVAAAVAYVAPGNGATNSITEIDPTVVAEVGPESRLIIPKINVDVPIVFGIGNDQASLMSAMSQGVAHFAIPGASAMPGEVGNMVLSGHSSNGVFENGDYKFIFAPLERLTNGDTIYINYQSKRYTYTVTRQEVVGPTNVAALVYATSKPMLTLITCVPIGTAQNRLLMVAEQISPDTEGSGGGEPVTPPTEVQQPAEMPGNSPTFFEGIWNFLTGQG